MKSFIAILVLAVSIFAFGISGCGKSDSAGSGASGAGQSNNAGAPASTSQLVGSWVHTTQGDLSGYEFTSDGKVQIYTGGGDQALSGDYKMQDDGRLGINLGGQVNYYQPTMSGDQLQLKETDNGNVLGYRRLNSGETMSAAMATQDQADKKALADRNAAVPAFLNRQDLVMVCDGNGGLSPSAIGFTANGSSFTGSAIYNDKPPHVDAISAEIQGSADTPIVVITFGNRIAPQAGPPIIQGGGVVDFQVKGSASSMTLTAGVDMTGAFAVTNNFTIKPDAAMHKQIADNFNAEAAQLNALKTPVIALFKDYAILKGTSQSSIATERAGFSDQFTLARNPQNDTFAGQGQTVNLTTGAIDIFPVVAAVGIVNDKPVMQIQSQRRMYQFSGIDTAGGKFGGAWQVPNNPNSHTAELTISQAMDTTGRDQLFAAQKAALQKMNSDTVFHTLIHDQNNGQQPPPNPVAVTLTAGDGGTFTGSADYPLQQCTMNLTGKEVDTPLGPQLALQYTGGKPDTGAWLGAANFITAVGKETWLLSATGDPAGAMHLSGYAVQNPAQGTATMGLDLVPYTDQDKAAIAQALAAGARFKVTNPQMNAPDDILDFSVDPASNKISGKVTSGGSHINTATGTAFTGDITDQGGWTELVMPITRPNNEKPVYGYNIVVGNTDSGLYINASVSSLLQKRLLGSWDAVQVKQ